METGGVALPDPGVVVGEAGAGVWGAGLERSLEERLGLARWRPARERGRTRTAQAPFGFDFFFWGGGGEKGRKRGVCKEAKAWFPAVWNLICCCNLPLLREH